MVQLTGIRLTQAAGVGTLHTGEVRVGCAGLREVQQNTAAVSVTVSARLSLWKIDFVPVYPVSFIRALAIAITRQSQRLAWVKC